MNAKEFFFTVSDMRKAQKEYLKTKAPDCLRRARYYENVIDMEVARVLSVLDIPAATPAGSCTSREGP